MSRQLVRGAVILIIVIAASSIVLASGPLWRSSPSGSEDPQTPMSAASSAATGTPGEQDAVAITASERAGQQVSGQRFGKCTNLMTGVDEPTPTVESALQRSGFALLVTVEDVGGSWFNTDGRELTASDPVTEFDVFRPVVLDVETTVTGSEQPRRIKVRLPGGQIGCDRYAVERSSLVTKGGRYIVFMSNQPDRLGNQIDQPTIVRAWAVGNDDLVETPYEGQVPMAQVMEIAARVGK